MGINAAPAVTAAVVPSGKVIVPLTGQLPFDGADRCLTAAPGQFSPFITVHPSRIAVGTSEALTEPIPSVSATTAREGAGRPKFPVMMVFEFILIVVMSIISWCVVI